MDRMAGRVVSVQVGMPRTMTMPEGVRVDYRHPNWTSGIFKSPVSGKVLVSKTGMAGDGQADLENHGGPDNVVLAYAAAHYELWRRELAMPELAYGNFGENLTLEGFVDETVCVGDTWRVGGSDGVLLQVTQPRQPCYKLARRLGQPHIVAMVRQRGWGGWYSRVLREGAVEAGMAAELLERPHPDWPIATAVQVMYERKKEAARAQALAQLPELSARWKRELGSSQ